MNFPETSRELRKLQKLIALGPYAMLKEDACRPYHHADRVTACIGWLREGFFEESTGKYTKEECARLTPEEIETRINA